MKDYTWPLPCDVISLVGNLHLRQVRLPQGKEIRIVWFADLSIGMRSYIETTLFKVKQMQQRKIIKYLLRTYAYANEI